jgi:SAM-dependent methyltransferase
MDSSDIIESLNKYKSEEFSTKFLNDTISYFNDKGRITKIFENECMLAGIRLQVLYNKYNFYVTPTLKKNDVCYRQLNLSKNQSYNLQNQMYGIKKNTFNICTKEKSNVSKSFIIISSLPLKEQIQYKITLELALMLLGINSLRFLEYQNLDNYCKIWNNSEKIFKELADYKKAINDLSWQERDSILISDNVIYNLLGTSSSSEMDILIISKNDKESKLISKFKNFNTTIVNNDESKSDEYHRKKWFMNKLPNLVGAPDIYTMLINTKYHFYFMGIKCISIFTNVEKSLYRSNWQSFLDVYLLKIINNLDCINQLCIKNISFNQKGKAEINNNKTIEIIYENIHKFAKKTYNINIPISYIKEHFAKCSDKFDTIYKNKVSYIDPLIREQIKTHRKISQHYIVRYGKYKDNLLDMGSGKLSGAYIYETAKIKNVYGVEPSIYSVQLAQEVVKKFHKTNFTLINAFADKPLKLDVKFDIITFIFTIHYMIKNIDVVIDNIKKAAKPGTIIIITCVNGDKILEKLQNTDSYEVKYYNAVYWGVYKFNAVSPTDKFLFYMKDVYGLEMGSDEYLVSVEKLITVFQKNNIKLKYSNNFKDEYKNIPNAPKLHNFQYDILNIQQILIFEI